MKSAGGHSHSMEDVFKRSSIQIIKKKKQPFKISENTRKKSMVWWSTIDDLWVFEDDLCQLYHWSTVPEGPNFKTEIIGNYDFYLPWTELKSYEVFVHRLSHFLFFFCLLVLRSCWFNSDSQILLCRDLIGNFNIWQNVSCTSDQWDLFSILEDYTTCFRSSSITFHCY